MMNKVILLILGTFALTSCGPLGVLTVTTVAVKEIKKDRSIGETIDDKVISGKIAQEFFKAGLGKTYSEINVEVSQGKVVYIGKVNTESEILKAVEIAWDQPGVKSVVTDLKIDTDRRGFDFGQYAKDTAITTQVLLHAFPNTSVKSVNYSVVTSNNVVYLFGVARSEEELRTISNIAAKVPGVAKVVAKHVKVLK